MAHALRRKGGVKPSRASIRRALPAALLLAAACVKFDEGGSGYDNGIDNANVNGTDVQHSKLPPVGYACYPHYRAPDGSVYYDVFGHYLKEHDGNWTAVHGEPPKKVRYEQPEVSTDPRCQKLSPW
jgi:hypothetical protein